MTIPLTFDWLTVAWLKLRLHLWWRSGRSPRQLALLLVLGVFSGCVPVTRFEEAQSAAQVEMEGRRRAEYQVGELKAENSQLLARMQQQSQALQHQHGQGPETREDRPLDDHQATSAPHGIAGGNVGGQAQDAGQQQQAEQQSEDHHAQAAAMRLSEAHAHYGQRPTEQGPITTEAVIKLGPRERSRPGRGAVGAVADEETVGMVRA